MKIYTRTGDRGSTSLYTGERRQKDDAVFDALGDVDELSAVLGVTRAHCLANPNPENESYALAVASIQNALLDLGAAVATPRTSAVAHKLKKTEFHGREMALAMEEDIDHMTSTLPPLTTFVLPGGGIIASHFHLARTVCRRAERRVAPLVQSGEVDGEVVVYLNRLSDWLFTAARSATYASREQEFTWKR